MSNSIFQKLEHLISEEIEMLMKETDLLVKMRADAEKLHQMLNQSKRSKSTAQISSYYTRSLMSKGNKSENLERFLEYLLKVIENILQKQGRGLQPSIRAELNSMRNRIKSCKGKIHNLLAPHGELHNLIRTKADWEYVEDAIDQALGGKTIAGINYLVGLLEQLREFEHSLIRKKYSLPKKVQDMFNRGLITTQGNILDAEKFFDYCDHVFSRVGEHAIINGCDTAKGGKFMAVARSIINQKPIKITTKSDSANCISISPTISEKDFNRTWNQSSGQNFKFTIYFSKADVQGYVYAGHSDAFIRDQQAASPKRFRAVIKDPVLRIVGYLNWNNIHFFGFRYANSQYFYKLTTN